MPRKRPPRPPSSPDLFDYLNILPPPLPRGPAPRAFISVIDDMPAQIPIGIRELQVTEAYLETVLAELLGPLP